MLSGIKYRSYPSREQREHLGDKSYEEIAEDFLIQLIRSWKKSERTRKITDKEVNYALRAIKEEISRYDEKDFSMTEIGKIVVRGDEYMFFSVIPEDAEVRIKYILNDINDYIRESTYGDFSFLETYY